MLVSIVTPSYNQAQFLEETILSVLGQDYPRIEYMVIDGGSTDGSVDIIRKYQDQLGYWVSEPDRGQADAINKGWRMASGEVLAYLNSDDTLEPEAVRRVVAFLQDKPGCEVVFGSCNLIDAEGRILRTGHPAPYDRDRLVFTNSFWQQAVFFRRVVLDMVGPLDPSLQFVMDYDLWFRAALSGCRFDRLPSPPLANFRQWARAKSWTQHHRFALDRMTMAKKYFPEDTSDPLGRTAWAGVYYNVAWHYYAAGQARRALGFWARSVRLAPGAIRLQRYRDYALLLLKIALWTHGRQRLPQRKREREATLLPPGLDPFPTSGGPTPNEP